MNQTHCLTKFAVLDQYCEKRIEEEKGWTFWLVLYNDFKLYDAKFTNQNFYNPLEEAKELYMELNKINLKEPKTLMKFVSTYGIPTGNQVPGGNKELKAFVKMDLIKDNFLRKFIDLQQIIRYWKAVKENDKEKLEEVKEVFFHYAVGNEFKEFERHIDYFKTKSDSEIKQINKNTFNSDDYNLYTEVKDSDLKDIAMAYITVLLNRQSFGKIKTTMVDVPCSEKNKTVMKKKIFDAVSFEDLFEVAFYQLRQSIFNEMEIRTCEHCGFPFEVTHERQRFCPPMFGRKRSTCENTYNQRIKRQRQKEKQ